MRKYMCIALCVVVLMVGGCAGRAACPIATSLPGDEKKSCDTLFAEILQIDHQIADKQGKKEINDTQNVGLGVAGIFFFPAWFLMDLKDADSVEIEALRHRRDYLSSITNQKGCF